MKEEDKEVKIPCTASKSEFLEYKSKALPEEQVVPSSAMVDNEDN